MAKTNRRQIEQEIEQTFGFVPKFYGALPDQGIGPGWALQRDLELEDTVLDHKTKELIGLAVAAHIKCKYCIYFHTQAAKAFGATEEEMKEAVMMSGLTATFSNSISGMRTDYDEFVRETDRVIDHLTAAKA